MESERTAPIDPPRITFTGAAVSKLWEAIAGQSMPAAGLRLQIQGRGPEGFVHILSVVSKGEEDAADIVVETQGFTVFVAGRDAAHLDGVNIHYHFKGPDVSGLEFDNPNPLWLDPLAVRIHEVLDKQINPAVAAHGGFVNLLEVRDQVAYIELGGGCQGCGMADVTLKQGIEVAIMEAVPEITRVVDTTDHASGTNPYFKQEKK